MERVLVFSWSPPRKADEPAEAPAPEVVRVHNLAYINYLMRERPVVYRGWTIQWTGWKVDQSMLDELAAQWFASKPGCAYRLACGCPGVPCRVFRGQIVQIEWSTGDLIPTMTSPLTDLQLIKSAAREKFIEFIDAEEESISEQAAVDEDDGIPF